MSSCLAAGGIRNHAARTYAAETRQFIPIQTYPALIPPIVGAKAASSSPVVWWSRTGDLVKAEEMSAQAATMDEPT